MEKRQAVALGRGSLDLTLATPSVAVRTPRLSPGFRFHPTDEELVVYYLRRKICRKPFHVEAIAEIDIYKHEPWELHALSAVNTTDQEWYFFMAFGKKYRGSRLNNSTGKGYWKVTEKDQIIHYNREMVGMKKTLVYHAGQAPNGRRTNWIMQEYRLVEGELEKAGVEHIDSYLLYKIFLNKNELGPPCSGACGLFKAADWEDDDVDVMVPCGGTSSTPNAQPTGLLHFSLSAQPKLENLHTNTPKVVGTLDSSSLEKSLPRGYLKFINDLEEERDKLKAMVMLSEARINRLVKSNEKSEEEIRCLRNLRMM